MNRAERRRQQKAAQKSSKTYTFTEDNLKGHVKTLIKAEMDKGKAEIMNEAVNQAMILLFVLPLKVLMDFYWKKSYAKKYPNLHSIY